MKPLLLTVLLFVCSVSVFAADKWTRVQSKNFTLVGNATENQIREVAEGLEVFRTVYSRFFKLKEGSSVATTVVVFRSDSAFKPFKPLYQGKPANLAGYFQSGADMNFIALAADMETPRVIYHEYVHRLMSDNMGSLPPWFQEGFAECFSSMEIEGKDKKVRIGQALGEHVALLNERSFMPLEKLFSVVHGSPEYNEEEKQGLFYAESWAFVHYMMFDSEQRRNQFNNFLSEIRGGTPPSQAFQRVFGTDLPTFQKVFEAYIQQRVAWNLFQVPTPQGLNRSKDMTARTMTEGEAEFYLGDLLLRIDRSQEAEPHLARAIKLEPRLGGAQVSMGRLLTMKGNETEALNYLKRATEIDPDNYLTHYHYASVLRRQKTPLSEENWATVRAELQKAVELAPQFVEAAEMLASVNLNRNVDIPQTVELLLKALTVSPGRDYLALQLAFAVSRTPQRESARPILRNLLANVTLELPLRQSAQSLVEYLDRAARSDNPNGVRPEQLSRPSERQRPGDNVTDVEDLVGPNLRGETGRAGPSDAVSAQAVPVERTESLPPGTLQLRGLLTRLECTNGLALILTVDGKTVRLRSSAPNQIRFTSFNSAVSGSISCGDMPGGGVPASVIYRVQQSGDSLGDPVAVDIIDANGDARPGLPAIPGSSVLRGLLTQLECSNGLTVFVTSDNKTLAFHANTSAEVAFLNGPNPDGTVTCGRMPGQGLPVAMVYRPLQSGEFAGEPLVVQFQRN